MTPNKYISRRQFTVRGVATIGASLAGTALTVVGCTSNFDTNHDGPSAPKDGLFEDLPSNPTALVLSSGGPRGFVHAGVLKALDEMGVRPTMVVGASVGSLVGAVYASGASGKEVAELAMSLNPIRIATVAIGAKERFSGAPMVHWINEQVKERPLESFKTRFAAVALRAADNKVTAFTRGDAGVAVQASCAIVGTFSPVRIRDELWVDPDFASPLPVRMARQLGAARVLSVDASAHEDKAPAGAEQFRTGDKLKRSLIEPDARSADINLHPFFGYWVSMSQSFKERAIKSGYEETIAKAKQIEKLFA
jgi:NTE family protein